MKAPFAFDTSALISLGHTNLHDLITGNYRIIVTESILLELKAIGRRKDDDAKSAQKWLQLSKLMEIRKVKKRKAAEEELFQICMGNNIPLISDDIKAIKQFDKKIQCLFSVHIVYLLYKKNLITKERALLSIEKMRTRRSWKENLISVTAKILFE